MKNLHLMPMGSVFDDDYIREINDNFPHETNQFILIKHRPIVDEYDNCLIDDSVFNAEYINTHCLEYKHIILHSLFLNHKEILALTDDAAKKIIWCVWGHDLYTVKKKQLYTVKYCFNEAVHCAKKILRGTYIRQYRHNHAVAKKVGLFHCIAIGYSYDETMIRKKYGQKVPIVYGPYFSRTTEKNIDRLRDMHLQKRNLVTNIIIGHSGFEFLEHEKYLQLLSKYKDENIHINMVLSYGASEERIKILTDLAYSIFGEQKCTILLNMLDKDAYYEFLTNMDIAIFPFRPQSALGNTKRMLYMGIKMYLDPQGVLAKGFKAGGGVIHDCNEIGKIPFKKLCAQDRLTDTNAAVFSTFDYAKNVNAWKTILYDL